MYEQHNKMCVFNHGLAAQLTKLAYSLHENSIKGLGWCDNHPFFYTKTNSMIADKEIRVVEEIIDRVINPPVGWAHTKRRHRSVVEPRHIAYWTMYYYTKIILSEIGFHFGRVSYSSVSTAVDSINELRQSDYAMSVKIKSIIKEIESLGYVMVNKDGRDRLAHKTNNRAFRNVFKEKQTKINQDVSKYKKCFKPKIKTLNNIDLVDVKLMDKRVNSMFSPTATHKINAFTDGVYFAEDNIRPSYKQLLDFYNSVPDSYYTPIKTCPTTCD